MQEQQNIICKSSVHESNVDEVDDVEEQLDQNDEKRRLLMLMYDLNQTRTMPRSNSMIF